MKLKDLARELQQSCDNGYGEYDVCIETWVTSVATGFEYKLLADVNVIGYSKTKNTVELFSNHFLELSDERHRAYENMVNAQKEYDKIQAELIPLAKEQRDTEEHLQDLLSKKKPWWKL